MQRNRNITIRSVVAVLLSALSMCSNAEAQVAFTMTKGKQDGTYISYKTVATNYGAELSQEVGAFRCSVPGMYYFSFTAMPPRNGYFRISMRKNRIPIVTTFAAQKSYSTTSGSAVMYLVQNDIVYLFVEDGSIYESTAQNRALTSFSGFRLPDITSGGYMRPPNMNSVPLATRASSATPEENLGEPDLDDKIEHLFAKTEKSTIIVQQKAAVSPVTTVSTGAPLPQKPENQTITTPTPM